MSCFFGHSYGVLPCSGDAAVVYCALTSYCILVLAAWCCFAMLRARRRAFICSGRALQPTSTCNTDLSTSRRHDVDAVTVISCAIRCMQPSPALVQGSRQSHKRPSQQGLPARCFDCRAWQWIYLIVGRGVLIKSHASAHRRSRRAHRTASTS